MTRTLDGLESALAVCQLSSPPYSHYSEFILFKINCRVVAAWTAFTLVHRSAPGSRWGLRSYPPRYRIYGWMILTKMRVPICLYCSNCTKFGQLILRKIITIVATRCQILKLKCTKFDFGWGFAPEPAGGAYSAPQAP